MKAAIFLDRDGTLNKHRIDPIGRFVTAPYYPNELELYPNTIECLQKLQSKYLLFLISNQPDAAKYNVSIEQLHDVHYKFDNILQTHGICFKDYFYCHHKSSDECICRKPKTYFPLLAKKEYDIDLSQSWFIGDQDVDVWCGKDAGMRTILLNRYSSRNLRGKSVPDYTARNLTEAVKIIYENLP